MTPERWQQIKKVLDVALTLGPDERAPYLDKTCVNDADLRREVESLLAAYQPTGKHILDEPAANILSPVNETAPKVLEAGHRIGAYQILEEIGRGGMGEVYRAVRADGEFKKEVALKTVRGGFDAKSMLEQFRTERQILASLDHPNIARLYDGGNSDQGLPYLVMELVDGLPIDSYCDAQELNVSARLRLFLRACSAVQYAHQRLVIHRDIKPGNILVTKEGEPKLLDFGIAKILDPLTATNVTLIRPMTPEYASPEQIRGEPITTASDVYSLGVVLYQLLTGRSPYRVNTRTPNELANAITETEPERPSTAILRRLPKSDTNNKAKTAERLCEIREGTLAKLQRRLSGDLDNIVLKSLRKEPQRRYASVEQLAEDLRRHLDGLPVSARKDSWNYRAEKFARRHTAGVVAAGLVTATLVAGVVVTAREAKIAESNRTRSQKRFEDVRKLSNSLIFEIHDSIESLPGATPARKLLLDRAVEYLDKLSSDAAGDADLQRELAWGYQRLAVIQGNSTESNLGDLDAALASDRKALALFQSVGKANPTNTIDQLNVAMMHRILSFSEIMEGGGREELEKAMAITDRLVKTDSQNPKVKSERSIEMQNLALLYEGMGDQAHALEAYQKNVELREEIFRIAPDYRGIKRSMAMTRAQLGTELAVVGKRKEALEEFDKAIVRFDEAVKSGGTPDVARESAVARMRKGDVQLMEGDITGASKSYQGAEQIIRPLAKQDPENSMLNNDMMGLQFKRGIILASQRKYDEAAQTITTAYKQYEASGFPADVPPGKAVFLIWIGEAEMGRKNFSAALQNFQKASSELTPTNGRPLHDEFRRELAESQIKTGFALLAMGKIAEAEKLFPAALQTISPSLSKALQDVPAYYVAAEANTGLGEWATAQAAEAKDAAQKQSLLTQACDAYSRSMEFWLKIPNPSRFSPGLFLAQSEGDVSLKLSHCQAKH